VKGPVGINSPLRGKTTESRNSTADAVVLNKRKYEGKGTAENIRHRHLFSEIRRTQIGGGGEKSAWGGVDEERDVKKGGGGVGQ